MYKCEKCGAFLGKQISVCPYCNAQNTLKEMTQEEINALSANAPKVKLKSKPISGIDENPVLRAYVEKQAKIEIEKSKKKKKKSASA